MITFSFHGSRAISSIYPTVRPPRNCCAGQICRTGFYSPAPKVPVHGCSTRTLLCLLTLSITSGPRLPLPRVTFNHGQPISAQLASTDSALSRVSSVASLELFLTARVSNDNPTETLKNLPYMFGKVGC